jgi:Flp pilus assembly protein TadG
MRSILSTPRRLRLCFARMLGDPAGSTAVIIALALSAIVGFAGLGTETASWYFIKRSMQGAADSAAATAAAELAASSSATIDQMRSSARSVASRFGFANGTGSTTVTVNNPPASGGYDNTYVEVVISQPQTALLSAVFLSSGPTITSRAVAHANKQAGDSGCVLALSGASVADVSLNGGVALSFSNCALYDNSPLTGGSTAALTMSSNSSLTASAAYIVGGQTSNANVTTTDGVFTGVNPAADPYASVTMPTATSCDQNNNLHNPSQTIIPIGGTYVFCGNVAMDANGNTPTLILSAGTYIFACGSNLTMTSGTLTAITGVTLVFERACPGHNAASSPGVISVSGNANLNITAPTSGTTAGIAIFQERYPTPAATTCNGSNCNSLGGGGTLNITGAAYFPNNPVSYSGGSGGGGASQCTQLIANTITFSGNATFNNNCTGTGVQQINYTNGTLVL